MTAVLPADQVRGVATVLPCSDLDATVDYFIDHLGFRLERISPADSPSLALLSGHGSLLTITRVEGAYDPGTVHIMCDDPQALSDVPRMAPNGTRVEILPSEPGIVVPPLQQSIVVSTLNGSAPFGVGRAGMNYRDLVPDRQGGRFIASHIAIPEGGPVPDYVHFHRVRFQLIFVYQGWVKVVYEDQGDPFIMQAGDCVLQPPTIRHRVLESSPGLEVIEIGCPAEHDTFAEHVITLPTGRVIPDREYGGQLFVRHESTEAAWLPFRYEGFEQQDLSIGSATSGLAGARVIRAAGGNSWPAAVIPNEFLFTFVMDGTATLTIGSGETHRLSPRDCFVVPADTPYALTNVTGDAKFLEVSLPADLAPSLV